jgi:hypothetical protein
MEIKIKNKKKTIRPREPHYLVTFEWMEGDADGNQSDSATFNVDEVEDLKLFIVALECCNHAYPNGRGGCDEYSGLPEYDAYFTEELDVDKYEEMFTDDELDELSEEERLDRITENLKPLNPSSEMFDHPSDSNYISTSFDGYEVEFIDENGDSQEVTIKFDKTEKTRFEEAEKFFE